MMNEYLEAARKKIEAGKGEKLGLYGEVMKAAVADALTTFCEQDAEFAQAVAQGGSFKDCVAAVGKCVHGNALSDMEAFGAAVKFFFPGAGIAVKMTIDLTASVEKKDAEKCVVVDLTDYF